MEECCDESNQYHNVGYESATIPQDETYVKVKLSSLQLIADLVDDERIRKYIQDIII